jgi:outer membrane protein
MNKSNALSWVTLAGLLLLYVFHFFPTSIKESTPSSKGIQLDSSAEGTLKVVYVQADAVMEAFEMMKDLESQFIADNKVREAKLKSAKTNFDAKMKEYERNVNTMTSREREKMEQTLQQLQQQFLQDQQELSQLAAMQEAGMISQVYDSLGVYFREIGESIHVDFILATQKASGVLYARDNLDITDLAIERINLRYNKSKEVNP